MSRRSPIEIHPSNTKTFFFWGTAPDRRELPCQIPAHVSRYVQGVYYEWKTEEFPNAGLVEGKQIGLVAQDVEKEIPELESEDEDGYKAVSYTKLTAVPVEAGKELKRLNQHQQERMIDQEKNSGAAGRD